jgi:hypothetical protein
MPFWKNEVPQNGMKWLDCLIKFTCLAIANNYLRAANTSLAIANRYSMAANTSSAVANGYARAANTLAMATST